MAAQILQNHTFPTQILKNLAKYWLYIPNYKFSWSVIKKKILIRVLLVVMCDCLILAIVVVSYSESTQLELSTALHFSCYIYN